VTEATSPATEVALLDGVGQAELVARGEVTAAELVEWAIERIERLNPALNAVVTPIFDDAISRVSRGVSGPFAGVPYLLKDLVAESSGSRFTEGSVFLRDNTSSFDSEIVVRLRRAGLVVVGKTNTPEFGMAPACEPVLFGATRNPWDVSRSTSGSSGGSAAAVASGMVAMAHGNDLGGSLRYPASACGLFALKPTRARISLGPESRYGRTPTASPSACTSSAGSVTRRRSCASRPSWSKPARGRGARRRFSPDRLAAAVARDIDKP
jgi:amidase